MEKSGESKQKFFKLPFYFILIFLFLLFCFSVQDFLDSAKKDFEERWSKNDKVRQILFCFICFSFLLYVVLLLHFKVLIKQGLSNQVSDCTTDNLSSISGLYAGAG